jgi:hypothetical protein
MPVPQLKIVPRIRACFARVRSRHSPLPYQRRHCKLVTEAKTETEREEREERYSNREKESVEWHQKSRRDFACTTRWNRGVSCTLFAIITSCITYCAQSLRRLERDKVTSNENEGPMREKERKRERETETYILHLRVLPGIVHQHALAQVLVHHVLKREKS